MKNRTETSENNREYQLNKKMVPGEVQGRIQL